MHSGLTFLLLCSFQLLVASSGLVVVQGTTKSTGPVAAAGVGSLVLPPRHRKYASSSLTHKKNHIDLRAGGKGASTVLSSSKGDDENDETTAATKARDSIRGCAKITAISAVLDLIVVGPKLVRDYQTGATELLLTQSFGILWKLIFSFNIFSASRLYESLNQQASASSSQATTTTTTVNSLERVLDIMTFVWRSSAFMITVLAAVGISKVWEKANSAVLAAIIIGSATISMYTNAKETKELALSDSATTGQEMAKIAQKGRTTVRAMLLCATSLLLKSVAVVATAARTVVDTGSYKAIIAAVPNLITPLATAGYLQGLRRAFLKALLDVMESNEGSDPNSTALRLKPQTRIDLANAQQRFYGDVRKTFIKEMILKIIAAIVASKVVPRMIAGVAGKS